MPTIDIYPNTVVSGNGFTTAQLANVLNNTTTYAVHTASVGVNAGIDGRFYFPLTNLPAGALINSLTFNVIAKASALSRRKAYSFDYYVPSTGASKLVIKDTLLTTADATYSSVVAGNTLGAGLDSTDYWRSRTVEWTATFISTNTTSTTTSWQKFWLTFDYTILASGPNRMFFGENF